MTDTLELKRIVSKALDDARAAGLSVPRQFEHAVRSVRQVYPEIDESDAVTAVIRIRGNVSGVGDTRRRDDRFTGSPAPASPDAMIRQSRPGYRPGPSRFRRRPYVGSHSK